MLTLEDVIREHNGIIKQLVFAFQDKIPGAQHDYDDFYQEVLFAIHKRLPKYDKNKAQPVTFIYRIVRNKLLDILRRECVRLDKVKVFNFSTLDDEKQKSKQLGEDFKYDFAVDMPVDAILMEKELVDNLKKKLPEDAARYMMVCLNPPEEMVEWIENVKQNAGPKPRRSNLPKNRIVEYLNKQGDHKWATNARQKLRSALTNLFPNT